MTSILKGFRRLALLAAVAVGLAAAGDAQAVTAGGVTIDVIATQSWPGGFNGAVRITNNSFPSAITSFQAVFKMNGTAGIQGNGWHGTISSPDGSGNRTVRNASWMGSITSGRSWDEGFSGTGTFSGVTFVSLTVNGQSISLGGDNGDTTPPSVSLSSSSLSVTQASTITLTATASDASGIAQVVFLDGSSPICTVTAAPYTCAVPLTAANNGTRVYTARATDASTNANSATSAAVNVSVNIQPQQSDFAISAPTSASVTRGASATASISISRTNFTSAVALSVSGLPSGVSASFNPSSTTGTSSTLTFTASSTATTGTSVVTVTGSANGLSRTASISLTVNSVPTSTFALSAPTAATVAAGQSASATISITRTNFTSAVAFTTSALPAGVTASYNPQSATGNSSIVTFTASSSAAAGTTSVTITGTGGSPAITRTVVIALTVTTTPTSTFTLAATPTSLTVNRGASGTSTIAITRTNFTSAVALSAAGQPSGVTVSFNPASATGTSSIVTFAASSSATLGGPVNVTITGTGGSPAVTRTVTIALTVGPSGPTAGNFAVVNGRVTKDGQHFPVRCGSWFGLQGRYEPASDAQNPRGAPMEQYVGNTFWASNHTRTLMQTMNEIKTAGITVIRLPIVHATLSGTDPQGDGRYYKNYSGILNDATYPMRNSRESMESMIKAANSVGIAVMLDIHSCNGYLDWRAGRLDARPPYADSDRDDYDFKREEWSCASTMNPATVTKIQEYNESIWLEDIRTLAGLSARLNVTNIIGIDIFNEPFDYTWSEWKTLTEKAYQAMSAVNPNMLLFVQGISGKAGSQDGSPTTTVAVPHGEMFSNPNWGENLYPAGADLPNVPVSKLVWSPHTYGPSVAVQPMFMDPAQPQCTGLEGDAVGDAKCNIVINPEILRPGWEEHFGYLKGLGYAIVVGEFGGNMDWPGGTASTRDQRRYSYLTDKTVDAKWQNAFVDYMIEKDIEGCYWSINPESGDTGGWYGHAYDPISNTGGWGEWRAFDTRKTTLLNRLWQGVP
jgi:aryl-phospho-beta-D-glucosidase BglC (GH1 family)